MSVTTTSPPAPAATPYATRVRRARGLLRALLWLVLFSGLAATILGFIAVQDTLQRYRVIVSDTAYSADAAQTAREALLAFHSQTATYLAQQDTPEGAARQQDAAAEWTRYQEALRQLWGNRSDAEYGEFTLFEATDRATLRYRATIDGMNAFVASNAPDLATDAFLQANTIMVQELLPPLNRLEQLKLESMEEAYATTSSAIGLWRTLLGLVAGGLVLLLILTWMLTRFHLHYRWTWQLVLASVVGLLLAVWFIGTLQKADQDVEVLVRGAYDTISGAQSTAALLTQARALQSMALFAPEERDRFLSDADEYLFLVEQQLCGERACTDDSFLMGEALIAIEAREAALEGQQTYGLPRAPLVATAYENRFPGEATHLEQLRLAIAEMRDVQVELRAGNTDPAVQQQSQSAYTPAIAAVDNLVTDVRALYDRLYDETTTLMTVNRVLAVLFLGLALLGAWGIQWRRSALSV